MPIIATRKSMSAVDAKAKQVAAVLAIEYRYAIKAPIMGKRIADNVTELLASLVKAAKFRQAQRMLVLLLVNHGYRALAKAISGNCELRMRGDLLLALAGGAADWH